MYESVVCENMPKTATARHKATNRNKGNEDEEQEEKE